MLYPKSKFDTFPDLRAAYETACDYIEIYGYTREMFKTSLDKAMENHIWSEAKRLLGR